jgi:predicted nuclease with RNAse H fold
MSRPRNKSLGIDLDGASSKTTGFAVIEGARRPRLTQANELPLAKSPARSERDLVDLVDRVAPDVLAIDAPLTLPPCLTCPAYCRGPDPDLCELEGARAMWDRRSNPVSRRLCELEAKTMISGLDPKPTMGLGIITARAVALVRKLSNRGIAPASIQRGEILEVYPRATLVRLAGLDKGLRPRSRGESQGKYRARILRALEGEAIGLKVGDGERRNVRASGHTLDAVIAAYTGWLHPGGLEAPPEGFNVAAGWIWFPKAV